MKFLDTRSEVSAVVNPPRRNELAIEILKFLTPALGLVLFLVGLNGKYPWLSKPVVFDVLAVLGALILIWFAKPRLIAWIRRIRRGKREQRFMVSTDARLRELVDQFTVFTASSDSRSLINILRSAYSQNATAVEQVIVGDCIGGWFACYRERLTFPRRSLPRFLSQCREFSQIVQEFNTNYVLRSQRHLTTAAPLPDHAITQLEEFRDEYAAFLRAVEPWAKSVANYLESDGVTDHPDLWRLAPTAYFERAKPFVKTKPPGN